jgi:HPt (histidine-containing phosphotransfer) domain-containing protein
LSEPPDDLEATIAALWHDARPRVLARVEVVETALAALRSGGLDPALAAEARREAHKLAGALGTFGMPNGTAAARAVERRLEAGVGPGDEAAMAAEARELRRIVEDGPAAARG